MKIKKSILFVADKPDWAYEFMVRAWLPYILGEYNCYVIFSEDYAIKRKAQNNFFYRHFYNIYSSFKSNSSNSDQIKLHKQGFFYKNFKNPPLYKYINANGDKQKANQPINHFDLKIEMAFYFQYSSHFPFTADKNIVGVFTDTFPHDGPNFDSKKNFDRSVLNRQDFYENYLAAYDHIIVGGGNLLKDYQEITDKVSFVYGIYGEEKFQINPNVGDNTGLTIGWTGTPDRPMKGFRDIIEPVVQELQKEGFNIELKTKFSGPYEELYSFYSDIDLVVIASSADSGPSLYAESCLSSVPVISTKVGLPLMGIKHNVNGRFIDRNKESLKQAIIELYNDRLFLKDFSKRVKTDYLETLGNDKTVSNILKILKD